MKNNIILLVVLLLISCKDEPHPTQINLPNYPELTQLDRRLDLPKEGEWLDEHPEKPESFEQYVAKKPLQISKEKKVIYLQPIGIFSSMENKMLELTSEYTADFFGLKTVVLKPIPDDDFPWNKKRIMFETEQLDASYIIYHLLPRKIPDDGIVIMGLTARDLYPKPDWNYVFGLASYTKRTAVTSMFRFEDADFRNEKYTLCLNRLLKTSTHEIGHMFTLPHCVNAECLMNGANHLAELDGQTNALCSLCLAKLSWNLKFDNEKRMKRIITFCEKHELNADALFLQKQYNIIRE